MSSFESESNGGKTEESPLSDHEIDYNRVYFTTDALRKVAQVARIKGERALKSVRISVQIVQAISYIIAKDGRYGTFTDFVEDWLYKGAVTTLRHLGGNEAHRHLDDLVIIRTYDNKVRREARSQFKTVEVPKLINEGMNAIIQGDKIVAYQVDEDLRAAKPMFADDEAMQQQIDRCLEQLKSVL